MPWTQLIVAFLAGYGLMSLIFWAAGRLGYAKKRQPVTTSILILAGNEAPRIEEILRSLQILWEDGHILEILVNVTSTDGTREIVARLANLLPGILLLPETSKPGEALLAARGQTAWVINLERLAGQISPYAFLTPNAPAGV